MIWILPKGPSTFKVVSKPPRQYQTCTMISHRILASAVERDKPLPNKGDLTAINDMFYQILGDYNQGMNTTSVSMAQLSCNKHFLAKYIFMQQQGRQLSWGWCAGSPYQDCSPCGSSTTSTSMHHCFLLLLKTFYSTSCVSRQAGWQPVMPQVPVMSQEMRKIFAAEYVCMARLLFYFSQKLLCVDNEHISRFLKLELRIDARKITLRYK